jgi:hypothetical protein
MIKGWGLRFKDVQIKDWISLVKEVRFYMV